MRRAAGGGASAFSPTRHVRPERAGRPDRHGGRGRLSRRAGRLQGQAGGQVPVHGFLDPREATRGLRGGDRGQSRQRARPSISARCRSCASGRPQARRRGRGRRMGRHMRRFDENATLDRIAERGGLSDAIIDRLAEAVRRSHARAPLRDGTRAARRARDLYRAERRGLRRAAGAVPAPAGAPA